MSDVHGAGFKRIIVIVLDSVGIGEAPDADQYGDVGSDTLGHIYRGITDFRLPTLEAIGLTQLLANSQRTQPLVLSDTGRNVAFKPYAYGLMQEISNGKDTMTGHWELMGIRTAVPLDTFPNGFPTEWIDALSQKTGRAVLGNCVASGTEIIDQFGAEQMKTGAWIVYTSADSVLQIAAHEEVISLEELYEACHFMREFTKQTSQTVGRIIARPYVGQPGAFERTSNRHDYALEPSAPTVLNALHHAKKDVWAIGKIHDIFSGQGISRTQSTKDNADGMRMTSDWLDESFEGLLFTNLVDFDAKFGHRRDPHGYAQALIAFDAWLPSFMNKMKSDDLLVITADHGNDPYHSGTDHTREYVPLIVWSPREVSNGTDLGLLGSFADLAATIAVQFQVDAPKCGTSFLDKLK